MQDRDLLLLSSSTVDVILEFEGTFPIEGGVSRQVIDTAMEPGGEGNLLIVFNRMGGNILPVGPVGDDYYGQFLRSSLDTLGIDTSQLRTVPGFATPVANCLIDQNGIHSFVSTIHGCAFAPDEEVLAQLERCKGVTLSGYYLTDPEHAFYVLTRKLARRGKALGLPVFFDPGPFAASLTPEAMEDIYQCATVISLNDEEALALSGEAEPEKAAGVLCGRTDALVLVKAGPRGCYARKSGEPGAWHPGFRVRTVDTMGAGDSFLAAFMFAWISGCDRDTCLVLANAAGAVKASKYGTGTKVPTFAEMVAILEKNGYTIDREFKDRQSFAGIQLSK